MVKYAEFYKAVYLGDSIPAEEWARLEARASAQLAKYKREYQVSDAQGVENAESMAICALADTLYYYEAVSNGMIAQSTRVGSVTTTNGAIDTSRKAQARELLNAARMYLTIYRGAKNA